MSRPIPATTCTALVPYDHNQQLVPARRKRAVVALVPHRRGAALDTQAKLFTYVWRQIAKKWEATASLRADVRELVAEIWANPRARAAAQRNPASCAQRVHRALLHDCIYLGVL